ncbi:MAG TPA: dihydrodipicolinate synthase family protein, partial [Verrucomicrobiae bacterium]|nr:dihydrodipicolinate synthase family protein [Verrucomicrobiae bacterium]
MGLPTTPTPKLINLVPAAHTPFRADGSLNLAAIEQQVAHLSENGIRIAFVGGSTGESHSLTREERR